ncbi:hypothetical protein GW17_00010938 [Ensete ventricosum]|nr:hypothetical protein GW17_00010938 [Ensete ventricosum]
MDQQPLLSSGTSFSLTLTVVISSLTCVPAELAVLVTGYNSQYIEGEAGGKAEESWVSYQYVGRSPSVHAPPSSVAAGKELSVEEIRAASVFSSDHYYPPSIHGALVGSPESDFSQVVTDQAIIPQGGYDGYSGGYSSKEFGRETIEEKEPYLGGKFDGKEEGQEVGVWELDLRSEFPVLFVPQKETRVKIPHSEAVEKCPGCDRCTKCSGKGMLPCATCGSRGLVKCHSCEGQGSLITRNIALVKWYVSY